MTLEELQAKVDELSKSNEALSSKNQELLTEVKIFKKKASGVEIDPAEFEALKVQLSNAQAELDKVSKSSKAEAEKMANLVKAKDAALQKHLLDGGLTDALAKVGVKPEYMDAAKALLREKAALKVDGDNYQAVFNDKPLFDGIKEWATGDAGKHFVSAPANTGGGAGGSSSDASSTNKGNLGGTRAERLAAIEAGLKQSTET